MPVRKRKEHDLEGAVRYANRFRKDSLGLSIAVVQRMASLRAHLSLFWLALVGICVWLGLLFYIGYEDSAGAQIARVRAQTTASCDSIAGRFRRSAGSASGDRARTELLQVILQLVLVEQPRIEGGVWSPTQGHLVYAYPTYEGTGLKHDVPEAERGHIESVATEALRAGQSRTDVARTSGEALVVSACPLGTPSERLTAWTMGRTSIAALDAQRNLQLALGVIGGFVLLSGAWFTAILLRAARHVRDVVSRMNGEDSTLQDWMTPSTGVKELDTMLTAFGQHRARLVHAETSLRAVQQTRARDQRLASLGRMTAGIAHEIRNPIAAMRLRAENALAGPPARQSDGLHAVLGEIVRLDGLVKSLMALVQPLDLAVVEFELAPWLRERATQARQRGTQPSIDVTLTCDDGSVCGDPWHLARALDNLLDNAVRHAAARVWIEANVDAANRSAVIRVIDDGPGVSPDVAERLFEPFATGRTDGNGLGLALAQEVAIAHGGQVEYGRTADGRTEFKLEWTWRA